jgi:hypothetical protein
MDTIHLAIPFMKNTNIGEIISALLALFIAIQTAVRAIPTPEHGDIKNPALKVLNLIFNHTNIIKKV